MAAMLRPVARMSSAFKIPGTAGSSCRRMRMLRQILHLRGGAVRRLVGFPEVDDDALAEYRVQRPFGQPGNGWALHDVPDEQPVVGTRQRMTIVMDADGAFQPPVQRVQAVRVVVPADDEPGPLELELQLGARVDADVPAGGVVVVLRQCPADAL